MLIAQFNRLQSRGRYPRYWSASLSSDRAPTHHSEVYADLRNSPPMARAYADFMAGAFGDKIELEGMTTASTDFGESVRSKQHLIRRQRLLQASLDLHRFQ